MIHPPPPPQNLARPRRQSRPSLPPPSPRRWTQSEAAQPYGVWSRGVTQPRSNDLLHGRVSRFSLDALVNIASALGFQFRVKLTA